VVTASASLLIAQWTRNLSRNVLPEPDLLPGGRLVAGDARRRRDRRRRGAGAPRGLRDPMRALKVDQRPGRSPRQTATATRRTALRMTPRGVAPRATENRTSISAAATLRGLRRSAARFPGVTFAHRRARIRRVSLAFQTRSPRDVIDAADPRHGRIRAPAAGEGMRR
jgi:hypothetical protein